MASTPDSSTSLPKSASYAVITTSFCPLRLRSAKSRTVIGRCPELALSNARAPQRGKLSQPEISIAQLGMGHRESGLAHALLLEQHDVEVQRARSPARIADAPGVGFDSLQRGEQILRRKLGFDGDHLIEKRALRNRSDRSGLFGVGVTQHPRCGEGLDRASRLCQKYLTLAEVGAERYVSDISHTRSRSRATSAYASGPGSATLGFRTAIRTRSTSGSWRARSAIRSPTSSRKLVCPCVTTSATRSYTRR